MSGPGGVDGVAALLQQAAALSEVKGADPFTAEQWSRLGSVAMEQGRFDLAQAYHSKSIELLGVLHGADSVDVALATVPLAQLYGIYLNRADDAIYLLEKSLDTLIVAFDDEEHPAILDTREILDRVFTVLENTRPSSRASRPTSKSTARPHSPASMSDHHLTAPTTARSSHLQGVDATDTATPSFTLDYFDDVSILSDDSVLKGISNEYPVAYLTDAFDIDALRQQGESHEFSAMVMPVVESFVEQPYSPPPTFVYKSHAGSPSDEAVSARAVLRTESEATDKQSMLLSESSAVEHAALTSSPSAPLSSRPSSRPASRPSSPSLPPTEPELSAPTTAVPNNQDRPSSRPPQHSQLAKIKAIVASEVGSQGTGGEESLTDRGSDAGTTTDYSDATGSKKKRHAKRRKPGHKKGDIEFDDDQGPIDADLVDVVAAQQALAAPPPVLVFPVPFSSFEEEGSHLKYSVDFMAVDPFVARTYLCRENEQAYLDSVGHTFSMPIFPSQIKSKGDKNQDYIQCSKHVMSSRIQRLLLEDQIRELRERNQQFIDLLALCVKKKQAFHTRLVMLEKEMEHIAEEKQGHLVSPGSRFGAFLSTRAGWVVIFEFLTRECKRLQQPDDKRAVAVEVVNEKLALDDIFYFWELMQTWQLLHSVFFRCKSGPKSYPIAVKGPGNPLISSNSPAKAGSFEDDSDRITKSTHVDVIPPPEPIDPAARIRAGEQAALAALPDDILETASLQESIVPDDDSSIASRPSIVKILADPVEDAHADAGSVASAGASAKESKASAKSEKSKKSEEKKSGGGGWGFSLGNLFGKKEEEKQEVVAPVERKLEPMINGTGLGEWSEVCEMLGCPQGEISLVAAAKAIVSMLGEKSEHSDHSPTHPDAEHSVPHSHDLNTILHGIVPMVFKSDMMMALEGMTSQDDTNPFLYNSVKHILDAVADRLESLMLESLRMFPKWAKALEACRKDRVRRSGGRMDQNHDGEVEVDEHGTIRIIPHADDIIDTDILHGSRQRIQVTIVMPELEKRISTADAEEAKLRGELACVVQFGYNAAVPFVQRAIRGTLARMRKNIERRDLTLYAMHAAAFSIQGMVRAKQGRRNFAQARSEVIGDLRSDMCIIMQRYLRGWTKRHRFQRHKEEKRYQKWWFGLTSMQALIRGYNARHRVRRLKAGHKDDRQKEEKLWNVELLQRVARGYIARKTIVRSLRIRKSISKRVLLLAEKYLQRGDLWSFLKEIDDEFARLGKEINQTKQREDEFADTFIEKVLQKRQGEFDGAWDRFGRSVTAQSNKRRAIENGEEGGNTDQFGDSLTAVGEGIVSKSHWGPATSGEAPSSDQGGEASIPGPLLRRAVSATVQEGVKREVQRQREGQDRGIKLAEKMKEAYEGSGSSATVGGGKKSKGASKGSKPQTLNSKSLSSLPSAQDATAKVSKEVEDAIRIKQKKKRKQQQPNNMQATTGNFLATAVANETVAGFAERKEPETGWSLEKTKSGESLLLDIPKGINDTMERLLRATALRCYVPEFFSGHDASSAYKMYLLLPPGLAKMRYEQEAFRYCQPAVTQLRVKGVNLIKDAMPPKRVRQFLTSVNTPTRLLDEAMDNLFQLVKLGDVPVGLWHTPTSQKQADLSEGKGTLSQAVSAAAATSSPPKKSAMQNQKQSPPKPDVEGVALTSRPASPSSVSFKDQSQATGDELSGGGFTAFDDESEDVGDPTLPSRLLLDMVERGPWASLTAAVDDILMHAAMLSVPFVRKRRNKYGVEEEMSSPWGHTAFKLHIRSCQRAASEDEKRELVRERFRACLLLTTPFSLRLKADGTLTVQDLVERHDLSKMGMPAGLLEQLEALLSTAVSLSVSSKIVPTVRDHLSTATEIFTVPMIFDPKFQRGPFDPYGRAPRIFPRLKPKKTQPDKRPRPSDNNQTNASAQGPNEDGQGKDDGGGGGGGGDDDDDDDDDMPLGLWEKKPKKTKNSLAVAHAKKLYEFQSDVPIKGKGRRSDDDQASLAESVNTSQQPNDAPEPARFATKAPPSASATGDGASDSPGPGQRRPRSKREMHERARALKADFEKHVRSGFERPYTCSHPGCDAAFSRAYSLQVHEKSHELFGGYHKFRLQPQVFLDSDNEHAQESSRAAYQASVSLPPLVQKEIFELRAAAAAKAWALTYDEQQAAIDEANKPPSRPTTAQVFGPELVFPRSEAPALRAVRDLPPSRGTELLPSTPGSPWRLSRGASAGSSRGSSRAGSRGGFESPKRGGLASQGSKRGSPVGKMVITPWDQLPDTPNGTREWGGGAYGFGGGGGGSVPSTPGSPSGRSFSRGSVTWADQKVVGLDEGMDDEDVPLLSAPPIRFGVTL